MDMDGCGTCQTDKKCDKLVVYSNLCMQMEMKECSSWHTLCSVVPDWPLCSTPLVPAMKMYFHTGINEYFLFKELVPQTSGEYILALIITFLVSITYEFLKVWRNRISSRYFKIKSENISIINENKIGKKI